MLAVSVVTKVLNNPDPIQASASIGAVCCKRKVCCKKNEEKLVEIKNESDEQFFDIENKEDKKEENMQEVQIPIFDGQEYSNWKKCILMYFKIKKCDIVVTVQKRKATKLIGTEKTCKL